MSCIAAGTAARAAVVERPDRPGDPSAYRSRAEPPDVCATLLSCRARRYEGARFYHHLL